MISPLIIPIVVLAMLALAGAILAHRLSSADRSLPVTAEWIEELSTERYRPMMRLLDSADIQFLRAQPGFAPRMEASLRAQRSEIFRGYLQCLDADFKRVCTALKLVMAESTSDRPDLATILIRQQVLFSSGLMATHVRLFFYRWGICTVDVKGLVEIFDGMRIELRTLVPSAMPVCA